MLRLPAIVLLLGLSAIQFASAHAAERVALVIGNGKYAHAVELPNPTNDARDVSAMLRSLGFEVISGIDLDKAAMEGKIREFARVLNEAKAAVFFYAGHGMQVEGENYLIPIDAQLADRTAVDFETIRVNTVLEYMKSTDRVSIALLDACRDNPLSRRFARSIGPSRSNAVGNGLASPGVVGGGLLIGFATSPDDVAQDGDGRNSPFTAALLRQLPVPGIEVQQLMTRVKADVYEATGGDQEPWHNSNLRQEFFMVPGPLVGPPAADVMPDQAAWLRVANSASEADLKTFISAWPGSAFQPLAEKRLQEVQVAKLVIDDLSETVHLKSNEVLRLGPGLLFDGLKPVETYRSLRAIGQVQGLSSMGGDGEYGLESWWIKVRTDDGTEGFVPRNSVIRETAQKKIDAFEELLSTVEREITESSGDLRGSAGIYTFTSCDNTRAMLSSDMGMSRNIGFLSIVARWFEGNTLFASYLMPGAKQHSYSLSYYRRFDATSGRMHFYKEQTGNDNNTVGFNHGKIQYDVKFVSPTRVTYKTAAKCDLNTLKYVISSAGRASIIASQWTEN